MEAQEITGKVFIPALEAAVKALGGTRKNKYWNSFGVPVERWALLPVALQRALGKEWEVSQQPAPKETWIAAQYIGPDARRRVVPIMFQHQPALPENGIIMYRINFQLDTL